MLFSAPYILPSSVQVQSKFSPIGTETQPYTRLLPPHSLRNQPTTQPPQPTPPCQQILSCSLAKLSAPATAGLVNSPSQWVAHQLLVSRQPTSSMYKELTSRIHPCGALCLSKRVCSAAPAHQVGHSAGQQSVPVYPCLGLAKVLESQLG